MHARKSRLKNLKTLIKRADFTKINAQGRKWVAQGFILQTTPNDLGHIRIGYTVTKKTEISAVRRNRIKRRLRAVAADILPLHAETSHDYVLIGRKMTASRPYTALCNDLKWCLGKLDLIKASQEKETP